METSTDTHQHRGSISSITSEHSPNELQQEKLEEFQAKERRKGIIYLSRIPPYMKPEKVRHLLEQYGKIDRVYLVPEDHASRKRRAKSGGNKKLSYVEGWVEYMDKKVAKRVALSLNNTPIGKNGHKFYDSDLWNIKYLRGFKWSFLTEKLNYERQIRAQKLKAEISQAKRDNEFYISRVELAKRLKKQKATSDAAEAAEPTSIHQKRQRIFAQVDPISNKAQQTRDGSDVSQKKMSTALLSRVFGDSN